MVRLDADKADKKGADRLIWVREELRRTLDVVQPEIILLEGYSYASTNQAHQVGELGGVIRVELQERLRGRWATVTPQNRAKFATGRPGAGKDEVVSAVSARTGIQFPSNDHCDAFILWCMVNEAYGFKHPLAGVPKVNKEAMLTVDWPKTDSTLLPKYEYLPKIRKPRKKVA